MMSPKLESLVRNSLERYGPSFQAVRQRYHLNIHPDVPADIPVYVCPLCINKMLFIRENILHLNGDFSGDHFPPESVGGKRKALVCRDCNSKFGTEIDFALAEGLSITNSLQGKGESTMKLQMEGSKSIYSLAATKTGDVIQLEDNSKHSHLIHDFIHAAQMMEETGALLTFKLKMNLPSTALSMKSLLKAAYLYFFGWAGYEFIYSETATNIRKVLSEEMDHPLENYGVFYDQRQGELAEGIYALTEPAAYKTFFVSLHITDPVTKREIRNIIVIPPWVKNAWGIQTSFAAWKHHPDIPVKFERFLSEKMEAGQYFSYSGMTKKWCY